MLNCSDDTDEKAQRCPANFPKHNYISYLKTHKYGNFRYLNMIMYAFTALLVILGSRLTWNLSEFMESATL